ncbi:MAG: hypothetical protein ACJ72W_22255 [Actinoallomurus sp.]
MPSSSAPAPEFRKPAAVHLPHRKRPLAMLTVLVVLAVMVAVGAGLAFATI